MYGTRDRKYILDNMRKIIEHDFFYGMSETDLAEEKEELLQQLYLLEKNIEGNFVRDFSKMVVNVNDKRYITSKISEYATAYNFVLKNKDFYEKGKIKFFMKLFLKNMRNFGILFALAILWVMIFRCGQTTTVTLGALFLGWMLGNIVITISDYRRKASKLTLRIDQYYSLKKYVEENKEFQYLLEKVQNFDVQNMNKWNNIQWKSYIKFLEQNNL